MLPRRMDPDSTGLVITLAITLLIALVGISWRHVRRRPRTSDEVVVNAFTYELFAAQSTSDMKAVIARHLPALLGTRRVWVSGYAAGRRQLIVPNDDPAIAEHLFANDFQAWTTLPLHAGQDVVGLMGVESDAARRESVKSVMKTIAPMIGQALQNTHALDALRETSLMDPLTGTVTRREGLARLHAELKRAQRTGGSMAVMLLDLDRFKSINDRCGHAMGDAVLTAVGQTLRRTLRASDIRCRWGGEEFLVVLPDTDAVRAQVAAQGLLKSVAAATVPTPRGPIGSTTSIGLTMTKPGETNLEAIIHRADIALYRAKHAGRNCMRVVSADEAEAQASVEDIDTSASVVDLETPTPAERAETRAFAEDADRRAFPGASERRAFAERMTVPFPDRRNPNRSDRRQVPGPGRRATDRVPVATLR